LVETGRVLVQRHLSKTHVFGRGDRVPQWGALQGAAGDDKHRSIGDVRQCGGVEVGRSVRPAVGLIMGVGDGGPSCPGRCRSASRSLTRSPGPSTAADRVEGGAAFVRWAEVILCRAPCAGCICPTLGRGGRRPAFVAGCLGLGLTCCSSWSQGRSVVKRWRVVPGRRLSELAPFRQPDDRGWGLAGMRCLFASEVAAVSKSSAVIRESPCSWVSAERTTACYVVLGGPVRSGQGAMEFLPLSMRDYSLMSEDHRG